MYGDGPGKMKKRFGLASLHVPIFKGPFQREVVLVFEEHKGRADLDTGLLNAQEYFNEFNTEACKDVCKAMWVTQKIWEDWRSRGELDKGKWGHKLKKGLMKKGGKIEFKNLFEEKKRIEEEKRQEQEAQSHFIDAQQVLLNDSAAAIALTDQQLRDKEREVELYRQQVLEATRKHEAEKQKLIEKFELKVESVETAAQEKQKMLEAHLKEEALLVTLLKNGLKQKEKEAAQRDDTIEKEMAAARAAAKCNPASEELQADYQRLKEEKKAAEADIERVKRDLENQLTEQEKKVKEAEEKLQEETDDHSGTQERMSRDIGNLRHAFTGFDNHSDLKFKGIDERLKNELTDSMGLKIRQFGELENEDFMEVEHHACDACM